jgi:hypothetical protein
MSKVDHLRDAYRHAGFVPQATLRSVAFDLDAFGVALVRRRKKRSAECAAVFREASTTKGRTGHVTSTALSESSISFSPFGEFCVRVVEP